MTTADVTGTSHTNDSRDDLCDDRTVILSRPGDCVLRRRRQDECRIYHRDGRPPTFESPHKMFHFFPSTYFHLASSKKRLKVADPPVLATLSYPFILIEGTSSLVIKSLLEITLLTWVVVTPHTLVYANRPHCESGHWRGRRRQRTNGSETAITRTRQE